MTSLSPLPGLPRISRQIPSTGWLVICFSLALAGCSAPPPAAERAPVAVEAEVAKSSQRTTAISLTGEIKAQVQGDLAFRVAGRIAKRNVDIGDHVNAGEVLATLETNEQAADVSSAMAAIQAANATLDQVTAALGRQKALLAQGFTTRSSYEDALQAEQVAQATLQSAQANLAIAQDNLNSTSLRSDTSGIITARSAEAGQVVEAAQSVFTLANDGGRDAVFDVYESLLVKPPADVSIEVTLLSNPQIKAQGTIREVSPTIDPATGTVKVKVAIERPPPEMELGAAVSGEGHLSSRNVFVLPWTAFFTDAGNPSVWVVDPATGKAEPKPVVVDSYRAGELLLSSGLAAGDIVVTSGTQLLRPGEIVEPLLDGRQPSQGRAK